MTANVQKHGKQLQCVYVLSLFHYCQSRSNITLTSNKH